MARPRHLALAQRYAAALDGRDAAGLRSLRAADVIARWPQTGEIAFGRDALERIEAAEPVGPGWDHIVGVTSLGPDELVLELAHGEPGGQRSERVWRVTRLGLDGESIVREVAYVAEPFDPPGFRSEYVASYDPLAEPPDLTEPGSADGVDREELEGWARALMSGDFAGFERLAPFHDPDWRGEYPQSGERFPSVDALLAAHRPYPGGLPAERLVELAGPSEEWVLGPTLPLRIHGSGACWMGEIHNEYSDGSTTFQVAIARTRSGRMHRTRWYWCDPSEPPTWRAELTDRYDALAPAD